MKIKLPNTIASTALVALGAVALTLPTLSVAQSVVTSVQGGRVSCYSSLDSNGLRKAIGCEVGTLLVVGSKLPETELVAELTAEELAEELLVEEQTAEQTAEQPATEQQSGFTTVSYNPTPVSTTVSPSVDVSVISSPATVDLTADPFQSDAALTTTVSYDSQLAEQPLTSGETITTESTEEQANQAVGQPLSLIGLSSIDLQYAPMPAGLDGEFATLFQNGWCEGGEQSGISATASSTCTENSVIIEVGSTN